MQEDLENRSVTLIISGGKLTGRVLKTAIAKYLVHRKPANKKSSPKQDLTKGNFAGSRLRKEHDKKAAAKAPT